MAMALDQTTPDSAAAPTLIAALRDFGLFDADWYLAQNPDVAAAGADPLGHFLAAGLAEGRDPSPLFRGAWYLAAYPDVAAAGVTPLEHFLRAGGSENRRPHPLLAPGWLRERLPPGLPFDNPLLGLLASRGGVGPRPLFDMARVARGLGLAPDSPPAAVLRGWFACDPAARPDPHPLLSLAHLGGQLDAYVQDRGATLSPHPLFDRDFVRAAYPGVTAAGPELTELDALLMLPDPGGAIATTPLFDPAFYRRQLATRGLEVRGNLQRHYMEKGAALGLDPHPLFDEAGYRARHGVSGPGLVHYLRHGRGPSVTLAPRFPDRFYLARHPEARDHPGTPLEHYLRHGRPRLGQPAWTDAFAGWDEVRAEVRAGAATFGAADPEVSVIIPAHDHFLHTLRCLWSILRAGDRARLQVVLADDASSDETGGFCAALPGLTYLRNPGNLGFLMTCNRAAGAARAPYLMFLNNDTAVLPGWIDSLLELARATPEAGIVGAKLVNPDGTLQEAGGYVWAGGGGANLGRGSDPAEPGFNLRRDADYISGAAILVPAAVWRAAGGFDPCYAPAYCEDTDLAMRLRQLGFRVIYQPASTVVHFEGVSSGTSTGSGVKAYQAANFERLRQRWAFALERHETCRPVDPRAIPRARRPRILMIDHAVPRPDMDAGSVIAWWHVRLYLDLGYEVSFLPVDLSFAGAHGRALQGLGVELLHAPYVCDIGRYLDRHAADFAVFHLSRVGHGGRWIERLRALCPATPVIFNTADLHFLRAGREARLKGDPPDLLAEAEALRERELQVIAAADDTIVVSTHERDLLRGMGVQGGLSVIPLVLPAVAEVPPRAGRRGIAFIGGYRHAPNVDAVRRFLSGIWPLIHEADPGLEFHIVGPDLPPGFDAPDLPGVRVVGHVADLDACLGGLVATVAPLAWGAGIKGKVGSSLAAGVPCVASSVAAEGMGLTHGGNVLIADTPAAFARAVLDLCADDALWQRLSAGGRAFAAREYAPGMTRARLLRQLAKVGAPPFAGTCPFTGAGEVRRFLRDGRPESLAADMDRPDSSARVAAAALARLAGHPGVPLVHLAGRLPPVAAGEAGLARALGRAGIAAGDPGAGGVTLATIPLDGSGPGRLAPLMAGAGRLILACPPAGPVPAAADPWAIAALVGLLERAGWEVRTERLPLPECALTGVALIEARRPR